MENRMILSLGQMEITHDDEEENFAKMRVMTAEAAQRGSDLVLFPETWASGGVSKRVTARAQGLGAGIHARVAALAKEHNITIAGSNVTRRADGTCGNVLTIYGRDGNLLAQYTKIHLFHLMDEHLHLAAGDALTMGDMPWGKTGLSICYDLRFPEMYRTYALNGARLILVPASWPHPRLNHWMTLLRARAIENQIFVAACNRTGIQGGADYFGHSCVIDPWGEMLVEAGACETLLTVAIDLNVIEQVRAKIPVFNDRNPAAYEVIR